MALLSSSFSALSQDNVTPEYLTIIADIDHPEFLNSSKIYISINGEAYKEKKIPKDETKGKYDYNPLIKIIREYNKLGWEIMTSNLSIASENSDKQDYIFIMMKREEPYEIDHTPVDTIIENK
jgi:hypothetical protein